MNSITTIRVASMPGLSNQVIMDIGHFSESPSFEDKHNVSDTLTDRFGVNVMLWLLLKNGEIVAPAEMDLAFLSPDFKLSELKWEEIEIS